jgi:hypothetical protein
MIVVIVLVILGYWASNYLGGAPRDKEQHELTRPPGRGISRGLKRRESAALILSGSPLHLDGPAGEPDCGVQVVRRFEFQPAIGFGDEQ